MFATNTITDTAAYTKDSDRALATYREARARGLLSRALGALTGRARSLRSLDGARATEQHAAGTRVVAIGQIRGTEGRSQDFDQDFNPLRETTKGRWLSVFSAAEQGRSLPPVELTEVDGTYYVRDGHHRISVARARGQDYVDAVVTVRK